MEKIIIDPHYCSREEIKSLKTYLKRKSWDFKEVKKEFKTSQEIKSQFDDLISLIEDVIKTMPQKGLKSEDCQRTMLQQAINEFSFCVNGIEESDLKEEKE